MSLMDRRLRTRRPTVAMSRLDPEEQLEAALALEWAQYCEAERRGAYQPLGFEAWKEKYYGQEFHQGSD